MHGIHLYGSQASILQQVDQLKWGVLESCHHINAGLRVLGFRCLQRSTLRTHNSHHRLCSCPFHCLPKEKINTTRLGFLQCEVIHGDKVEEAVARANDERASRGKSLCDEVEKGLHFLLRDVLDETIR